MISQGVEVLGITDHNYGIAERRGEYLAEISRLSAKYATSLRILRGIEINTLPGFAFREPPFSEFDYCLVEHLDLEESVMNGDIIAFTKDYGCPVGIAHTDIFAFAERKGIPCEEFVKALADAGIFWELNVSYDSIHGYREHEYVKRFMQDKRQQEIVKSAGLYLSVGFDGHRMEDYRVDRVEGANQFILSCGFKHAIDLILK
jgi:histidinol phosphatase-like PHP family hydrolase